MPDPERPFKDCINLSLKVNNLQRLLRGNGKPLREWKGFLLGNYVPDNFFKHHNSIVEQIFI